MTQIEQIKAEIERLREEAFDNIKDDSKRSMVSDVANSRQIAVCKQLLTYINSLPAEQPSEDLEKEIDRFQKAKYGGDVISVASIACHFANWQKEQMMKSAIDGEITKDFYQNLVVRGELPSNQERNFCFGDKVKIIVVRKDERCSTE